MKVKDIKVYEDWKNNNTDEYGACIFRFAERWANLMETEIKNGAKLEDIAERTSNEADTEYITGYMYGCAVSILHKCWIYGKELKRVVYKE